MKHFFNDPLTIYDTPTRDGYGRETWGTGVAVNGRFVESSKLLFTSQGESKMADALIHVPADTEMSIGSRVVFNSSDYRVIRLIKAKDFSKVRFIKAFLEVYKP